MIKVFINLDGNEIKDLLIFKKTLFCKLSLPLTNIGRNFHSYMLPDLKMYFTEEEIKNSYLFERNEPNALLKSTNNLGKKYIIAFASKTNVKKFEKISISYCTDISLHLNIEYLLSSCLHLCIVHIFPLLSHIWILLMNTFHHP